MRFKNGAPLKVYILVNQRTGDVEAYTMRRNARLIRDHDAKSGITHKIVTYVQEKK